MLKCFHKTLLISLLSFSLHLQAAETIIQAEEAELNQQCIPAGKWLLPSSGTTINTEKFLPQIYKEDVILLGEHHANTAHHQWQLNLLNKLYAKNPNLIIGLEMFPRRMQPLLDQWVNKTIDKAGFIKASEWDEIWAFDFNSYFPMFSFARENNIPLVAINVDRSLLKMTGKHGWDNIPEKHRQGITDPAKPTKTYVRQLAVSFQGHYADPSKASKEAFLKFVQQQLLWDRAMAEAIASTKQKFPTKQLIGIVGSWHIINGHGIPHQLKSLGIDQTLTLVPWDDHLDCNSVNQTFADAIFGFPSASSVSLSTTISATN